MSDNQDELMDEPKEETPKKPIQGKRKVKKQSPPGKTVEARERQLISLAYDVAEKQLRSGEITSQTLTHFLKMGASTAILEKEKLQHETALLKAKADVLISEKNKEVLFKEAIAAFKKYSGQQEASSDQLPDEEH
jgi:predicted GNAT family acetyltransferase